MRTPPTAGPTTDPTWKFSWPRAIAAGSRSHEVAEVRSAVPLDDQQQRRLAAALSKATGKQVEVKVVVDPNVLGGIVARIGDTVIDGSIRRRLAQLKERI